MRQPVPLVIVGAGGHGRSVLELTRLAEPLAYSVTAFLDDQQAPGTLVMGVPVWGPTSLLDGLATRGVSAVHIAIGHNATRQALSAQARQCGLSLATLVHPRACVSPSATLGAGSAVMAQAVVGTEATLGSCAIVNVGAVVDHHAQVGDCGHLGANATMAGGTTIGARAWLQAGAALGYGVRLADDSLVAPGEGRA